jgi:hypothetical protein
LRLEWGEVVDVEVVRGWTRRGPACGPATG